MSDDMRDLRDRLHRASNRLADLATASLNGGLYREFARLEGKADGVSLALSYVEEYLRTEKEATR